MSLEDKIKNLVYTEEDVGATVKITKKYFKWQFDYNFVTYRVEMYDSKLSGKKRVLIDGKLAKEIEE